MATRLQPPPNKPVWKSNWTHTQPLKSPGSEIFTSRGTNLQQECSKTTSRQVLETHSEGFGYNSYYKEETVPRPVLDIF